MALGYAFDDNNRVDVTLRTDGVYGAGFRGSSANVFAYDQRFNRSVDATFNGRSPDGRMGLMFQAYYVTDVDDLNNPSPLSNLNAPAARTNFDDNRRQLGREPHDATPVRVHDVDVQIDGPGVGCAVRLERDLGPIR